MKKLLEFQKRVEAIKKDAKNPFFKSNYFDINSLLAEVKPLLNELGLILLQPFKVENGKNILSTLIVDSETGDYLSASSVMLPDLQDPQKLGSAITYLRRYSLQSLLALQAEDDDANLASKVVKKEDDRKQVIINLCKQNGFNGGDYKNYVFGITGLVLEEKNFDRVIEELTKLIKL